MQLSKWLDKNAKSHQWMAVQCGVTPMAVWLWRYRMRTPRPAMQELIGKITNGEVLPKDLKRTGD